ncbi:MAG: NUDIX pyrophosphatase [Thermoplasmatales archaeon]|nr:NUDIX pyrophosphatase [Thermoplasmatales archaeon]
MTELRNTDFNVETSTEKHSVPLEKSKGFSKDVRNLQANSVTCRVTNVVSCFIKRNDRILLLKRSERVRSYRGKWATVSGYVEKNEKPEETALKEIREETGIEAKLIRKGKTIHVKDKEGEWWVHPFLFEMKSGSIKIDWEHVEYRWIRPEEIKNYDTVPMLKEALENVI